jgi:rhamnogalacturonan endolyase
MVKSILSVCMASTLVAIEPLEPRQMLAAQHAWTFNDGTARDSVGTAHATLHNGAAVSNGRLMLQNNGLTSGQAAAVRYASLPAGIIPDAGSVTVELWYLAYTATINNARVVDVGDVAGAAARTSLSFSPQTTTGDARAILRTADGVQRIAAAPKASTGYLRHAVLVIDDAARTLSLYLDGTLASSSALNATTLASLNDTSLFIGRSLNAADPGFSGAIDEVRVYHSALDAAAVQQRFAAGPTPVPPTPTTHHVEALDRGVVALNRGGGQVYVGWRLLGYDPPDIAFNVYRSTSGAAPVKLNASPITQTTDFLDTAADPKLPNRYTVRAIIGGVEQPGTDGFTLGANSTTDGYLRIPLQIPEGGVHRDGVAYRYAAFEASPGDLDGDGQYEIVLNWSTVNLAASEYTAPKILDAYRLDGTRLWRINLGPNYWSEVDGFLVYDLDGDGRAEVVSRTADGTRSGTGEVIGDPNADWVNTTRWPTGWVVTGPQFLTVFDGLTGAIRHTVPFEPALGTVNDWGDDYGQRGKQILGTIAYLDGQRPSMVWTRGIYLGRAGFPAQTQLVAYDFRDGQIRTRWHFRAGLGIHDNQNSNFVGQGNHNLSVADVDADGKHEIVYGAMVVDDDGTPRASTGMEHGDALHVSDFDPSRPGMEVFGIHENEGTFNPNRPPGAAMYDPATGQRIFGVGPGIDVGRGNAADIDPTRPGAENWGGPGGLRDVTGATITETVPANNNFLVWWDADLTRELLDRNYVQKWNWTTNATDRVMTAEFVATNQGTKQFPTLSGDLLGDWREEIVWRAADNSELRIYTTTIPATSRLPTLVHDTQYRVALSWQNFAYNQPPHPSFFLGAGMTPPQWRVTPVAAAAATRPAAPASVSAVVVSPREVAVQWQAVPGATSYRVKRSDDAGGTFFTVGSDVVGTKLTDSSVAAGGRYRYTVTAIAAGREGEASLETPLVVPLPAPWVARDIGAVVAEGRAGMRDGVVTIRGAGAPGGDGLHLLSQDLSGDHTLIARVDFKTNRSGHAGLSFRKSAAANAAYVAVVASPTDRDRIFFYTRANDGGSVRYDVGYASLPVWLRLVRTGNAFAAAYSSDGVTWTAVGGPQTVSMPASVPAGLVVSGSATTPTTARFSDVQVVPTLNAPPRVLEASWLFQSVPMTLVYTFSEMVAASLSVGDVVLQQTGRPSVLPAALRYDATTHQAFVTLPIDLPSGSYRAAIAANAVQDGTGLGMAMGHVFSFSYLRGDLNRDGAVNNQDIAPFVQALTNPAAFAHASGFLPDAFGDVNADGVLNNQDLSSFVSLLTSSRPATSLAQRPAGGGGLVPAAARLFSSQSVLDDADDTRDRFTLRRLGQDD